MDKAARLQELRMRMAGAEGPTGDAAKLALDALKKVVKQLKLPINPTNVTQEKYPVKIPSGFESLFDDLWIEVSWKVPSVAEIKWNYVSSGRSMGDLRYNATKKEWSFRPE